MSNKVKETSKEAKHPVAPRSVKLCLLLQTVDTILTYSLGIYLFLSEMKAFDTNSSTVFINGVIEDSQTHYRWIGLTILIVYFLVYFLALVFGKAIISDDFCAVFFCGLFGMDTLYILKFKDNAKINDVCCYGALVLMVSYTLKLYTISIIGFDNNIFILIVYLFSLFVTAFSLSILHINWSFENIYLLKQRPGELYPELNPNREFLINNKQYILLFIMYASDLFLRSMLVMMVLYIPSYNWIYYIILVAAQIVLLLTYYSIHNISCMELDALNIDSIRSNLSGYNCIIVTVFSIVVFSVSLIAMMNTMSSSYVYWGYLKICKIITFIRNSIIGLLLFIVFIIYSMKTKENLNGIFWFIVLFWIVMYILFILSYLCYNYRYNEIYKEKLKEKEIADQIQQKKRDEEMKKMYGVTEKQLETIQWAAYNGQPLSSQQNGILIKSLGFDTAFDSNIYDENHKDEIDAFLKKDEVDESVSLHV